MITPTMTQSEDKPLFLEMRSISRRFPGVLALSEVNFTVRQNEVVALVGENGTGKSTLMKILSGVYTCDSGEIIFKGKPGNLQHVTRKGRRG